MAMGPPLFLRDVTKEELRVSLRQSSRGLLKHAAGDLRTVQDFPRCLPIRAPLRLEVVNIPPTECELTLKPSRAHGITLFYGHSRLRWLLVGGPQTNIFRQHAEIHAKNRVKALRKLALCFQSAESVG